MIDMPFFRRYGVILEGESRGVAVCITSKRPFCAPDWLLESQFCIDADYYNIERIQTASMVVWQYIGARPENKENLGRGRKAKGEVETVYLGLPQSTPDRCEAVRDFTKGIVDLGPKPQCGIVLNQYRISIGGRRLRLQPK